MSCGLLLPFIVVLVGFSWPGCHSQDLSIAVEFSEIVFADVSQLNLYLTMLGNFTDVDPESGLTGIFADLWGKGVSDECLTDGWTLITDTLQFKEYALQMRAAQSHPPRLTTMAFTGNGKYLANYELCLGVKEDDSTREVPMTAKVCDMNEYVIGVQIGMCVPSSCSESDLYVFINTVLSKYNFISGVYFSCLTKYQWTWDTIFVTCLLSLFAIGVICGTTYDLGFRRLPSKAKDSTQVVSSNVLPNAKQPQQNQVLELNERDGLSSAENDADKYGAIVKEGADNHEPIVAPVENNDVEASGAGNKVAEKKPRKRDVLLDKILMSFSIVTNGSQVLQAKKSSANLGALNGLRVLSMFWIILYHTAYFLFGTRLDNVYHLSSGVGGEVWFEFIWEAPFGVDTFFVLSGLLVTYLTMKQMDKSDGKINWVLFYVHRYVRLTPVYMICLGIWTSLLLPIGIGSNKTESFIAARTICKEYWWTNLLYINNLVPYPGSVNLCMGWTWYLANDMQFFIFTPIVIFLLFKPKRRRYGLLVLGCVTVGSCIVTAAVAGYWGFTVGNYSGQYNNRSDDFPPDADRIYAKPWCRVQSYTVGVFVGYLIYKYRGRKVCIPLIWNLLGWVLALGTMVTVLLAMSGTSETEPLPQWFAATWLGIRRFLFAAGVGWVAFACVTGNGGPVDKFLSWNFWLPMARLNYCAYLLHPCVIFHFLLTKKAMFHYTPYEHMVFFFGVTVVTYLLSLFITLLVEVPSIGIEKALLGRPSRK